MGETQLGTLQEAQNRAMRVVLHRDRCTKIEHMVLQFMSVKQKLRYTVCIFVYKMLNDMLPLSLRNKIETMGMHTRQAGKIVLGFRKMSNAQKRVFYKGTKLYNSLPLGIRECDGFKRELKDYTLNRMRYV